MFEKKDDKIFDYAFGELDAHEAQIFEASLLNDDDSLAEVEFLRSMKEDLVSLRDIPEMQFSKERLRSAILGQGLKPIMPWINWLLAPSAVACVAALGYVMMGGLSHREPAFVPGGKPLAMGPKPTISLPKQTTDTPLVASRTKTDEFPDINTTVWASDSTSSKVHRSHSSVKRQDVDQVEASHLSAGLASKSSMVSRASLKSNEPVATADSKEISRDVVAMSSQTNNDAFKVAFGNAHSTVNEDSKIIVIDKDQDSGVGAATATEVVNSGNVIVGG